MRPLCFGLVTLVMACSGGDPTAPAESSNVASITIAPATATLALGDTLRLKVTLRDASARELANRTIAFTSSNERVVSVDATGLVRALAEGEATVTAASEGRSGRSSILVVGDGPCLGCWDY